MDQSLCAHLAEKSAHYNYDFNGHRPLPSAGRYQWEGNAQDTGVDASTADNTPERRTTADNWSCAATQDDTNNG